MNATPLSSTRSAVFEGHVRHRRTTPVPHAFGMRLYMMWLDLDELPGLFAGSWTWSPRRPALAWFRRADYLGDAARPLPDCVREHVAAATGARPLGPIRMLTQLRTFGYCFNPVTFYFCHGGDGALAAIVAEITNTPWQERRAYVLPVAHAERHGTRLRFRFAKDFHVSPFLPMDLAYDWSFTLRPDRILVHMDVSRGAKVFDATLLLRRRELTRARLWWTLLRHPFMTARVTGRIHFEALRLWLKRVPVHSHPATPGPA